MRRHKAGRWETSQSDKERQSQDTPCASINAVASYDKSKGKNHRGRRKITTVHGWKGLQKIFQKRKRGGELSGIHRGLGFRGDVCARAIDVIKKSRGGSNGFSKELTSGR